MSYRLNKYGLPQIDSQNRGSGWPIRCVVGLCCEAGRCAGIARMISLAGVRVQLLPDECDSLLPGKVVEMNSDSAPIGPIRTQARVMSIDAETDDRGRPVVSAGLKFVALDEAQRYALKRRLDLLQPVILTIGLDPTLTDACRTNFRVLESVGADGALSHFDREDIAVLVLGPLLKPVETCEILSRTNAEFPGSCTVNVVLNADTAPELFQSFVDEDRLFYLARGSVTAAQLRSILIAAADRFQTKLEESQNAPAPPAGPDDRILEFCFRLSQQVDLASVGDLLVEAVEILIDAERAQYLIYDEDTETLWSKDRLTHLERRESAATGVVGYVARTSEAVRVDLAAEDPRYDGDTDNPTGAVDARFIAAPISGVGGDLAGVVSAVRDGQSRPFSDEDARRLKLLAACAAPTVSTILLQSRIEKLTAERAQSALNTSSLYRQEALDYQNRGSAKDGEALIALPIWLRRSNWVILAAIVVGLCYSILAKVHEYAAGPVLIRARNKITLTSETGGLVRSVEVPMGARVRLGDLVIRFYDVPGSTPLDRFKAQLRAPSDGVISDIRVREGQQVNPGDQVASIINEASGYELIALLPGSYAPQIRPGMSIVLKLQGYPESREVVPIETLGAEIIGPHEAARYLGRESTDALTVSGPVVIVRSQLLRSAFRAGERSYRYQDGMAGKQKSEFALNP